jgi:glycosyltransferase involved in cell wall biosynthesis
MTFRPCAIVPSRNHYRAIGGIVDRLRAEGLPVFVVDDGSAEPARTALAELHAPESRVTVLRLDSSQGKGGAVIKAFGLAAAAGFSHAIQVDADGQHDLTALPDLLASSRQHPGALVLGSPVFDRSIPKSRKIGRWLTHVWVCVETLSPRVIDSMCGFRVYPLAPVMSLLARERLAQGMAFDTDVFVRLRWHGVPTRRSRQGARRRRRDGASLGRFRARRFGHIRRPGGRLATDRRGDFRLPPWTVG